jgi:hypothetical protein
MFGGKWFLLKDLTGGGRVMEIVDGYRVRSAKLSRMA